MLPTLKMAPPPLGPAPRGRVYARAHAALLLPPAPPRPAPPLCAPPLPELLRARAAARPETRRTRTGCGSAMTARREAAAGSPFPQCGGWGAAVLRLTLAVLLHAARAEKEGEPSVSRPFFSSPRPLPPAAAVAAVGRGAAEGAPGASRRAPCARGGGEPGQSASLTASGMGPGPPFKEEGVEGEQKKRRAGCPAAGFQRSPGRGEQAVALPEQGEPRGPALGARPELFRKSSGDRRRSPGGRRLGTARLRRGAGRGRKEPRAERRGVAEGGFFLRCRGADSRRALKRGCEAGERGALAGGRHGAAFRARGCTAGGAAGLRGTGAGSERAKQSG